MIICACLVDVQEGEILLIRARDNKVWYLPGGKINDHETPKDALVRELQEELNVHLEQNALTKLATVIGPNHDHSETCQLICFAGSVQGTLRPQAEIKEAAWVPISKREIMAPLVHKLIDTALQ